MSKALRAHLVYASGISPAKTHKCEEIITLAVSLDSSCTQEAESELSPVFMEEALVLLEFLKREKREVRE